MATKRNSLTPEQRQSIRERYAVEGARALAEALGVPKHLVKNVAHKEGLRRDPDHSDRKPLSSTDRQFLADHYADSSSAWIATQLGRTLSAVYRTAQLMGLKKSEAFLNGDQAGRLLPGSQLGASTRFKKGQVPHTKGKRVSPEQYAIMAPHMFKKGNLPHTTKSDGHISLRRDADGREYFWIRISLGKWQHLHRYLWEKAYGAVPEGYVITFKDGDRANCVLENLEMITDAERLSRTTIMNLPKDLRQAIWALGRLRKTLEKHGQEHNG